MFEFGENFIDDDTLKIIWKEIELIYPTMLDADRTGAAIVNGKIVKRGKGFLSQDWVAKMVTPTIATLPDRMVKHFKFEHCNSLVNYYDEGDYYGAHTDDAIKTMVIPLRHPNSDFTGGEFKFSDLGITIPFINNSYVIFNGKMKHEVTPIHMNNKDPMMGRFSLTYFFI